VAATAPELLAKSAHLRACLDPHRLGGEAMLDAVVAALLPTTTPANVLPRWAGLTALQATLEAAAHTRRLQVHVAPASPTGTSDALARLRTGWERYMVAHAHAVQATCQPIPADVRATLPPAVLHALDTAGVVGAGPGGALPPVGAKVRARIKADGDVQGTVRYVGTTRFAPGLWVGLELAAADSDGTLGDWAYEHGQPRP
jgi:hypothetical protein